MKPSPLPSNETDRLKELYRYKILDTESEKEFEDIVELASQIANSSMALISLIDENRQWFKARKGLDAEETNRDISFCSHAIMQDDVMIVEDALNDKRFADNPLVTGEPNIRFYAGMPLVTNSGHKLGTLCLIDNKPGTLNQNQIEDLTILGKHVVKLFDLRLMNLQLKDQLNSRTSELQNVFDRIGEAFISLDKNWNYVYANSHAGELVKRDPQSLIGKNVWNEFPQAIGSATYQAFHKAMSEQTYVYHTDYYAPLNLWQENHIYPSPNGLSIFIRDISDRKLAEKKLIESLEGLERAEKNAHMGSWSFDVATGQRRWSKQFFTLMGFDERQGVPSIEEYITHVHPDDRWMITDAVDKMKRGELPEDTIVRTNPKILPLRYIYRSTYSIKNEIGRTVRFEGVMIDISERKKIEDALSASEERYRSIFENAVDGIYQSTMDGKFRIVNPAMAKMFGYDSPQDMMRSVTNISQQLYANPEERIQLKKLAAKNGIVVGYELQAIKKNKEVLWVRDNVRTVYDKAGNVSYLEGTLEDITERKLAELKLRISEDKLRAFFRSTDDASVLLGTNLEVLSFNQAASLLFGDTYNAEMKEGMIFTNLIYPELRPTVEDFLKKALQGETNKAEFPIPSIKLGKSVWWLTSFMPAHDKDGAIIGAIASATNIDAVKRAQLKIKKQFEDLQKTNHELDRFVYSVSHDLRAPLSTILGLTSIAEMEKPAEPFLNYFKMIKQHVTKLDHFISEILDYSLNARTIVHKDRIDFHAVFEEVRVRLQVLPGHDQVKVEKDIFIEHPFYGDKGRLEIVLNNLYSNSIKYRDSRKPQPKVKIHIRTTPTEATLHFSDNGIGIEEKHLSHVFEMFYRASENAKGSGLGLYIAREAIERMNGTIQVESVFGESTSFKIILPNRLTLGETSV